MLNLKGKNLGRYHMVEPLGEGGMAVVYKAYDANLDRDVAIKVIRTEIGSDPSFLQRFQREARALAKLDHPFILKVLDYGEQDGLPYLVMPFISGGTLKARMGRQFSPADTAQVLAPIARALAYAHSQGIIHRDVKPANILITATGAPILSDFGIAKMLETDGRAQITASGVGMGTPDYMAPEQWLGTTDARTDVYALGVILYQMITGRLPYQADTPAAVLLKHMQDPLPRPSEFAPGLPNPVEHVIFKALAKDSAERFQDMDTFATALERIGSGAAQSAEVDLATLPRGASLTQAVASAAHTPEAGTSHQPAPGAQETGTRQPGDQTPGELPPVTPDTGPVAQANPPRPRRLWLWIGIGALVLIAAVCALGAGGLALFKINPLAPAPTTGLAAQPTSVLGTEVNDPGLEATIQAAAAQTSAAISTAAAAGTTEPSGAATVSTAAALDTKRPPLLKIDGLPEDIPILPDNNGDLMTQDSAEMQLFMYTTLLPYTGTAEYFKEEMLKLGWKVQSITSMTTQNAILYTFQKDGRTAMINCAEVDGQTMVQVMLPKNGQ